MKIYYSFPDILQVQDFPQALQHEVIHLLAKRLGGKIDFYTTENTLSTQSMQILRAKLEERPKVSGFLFFTLRQFITGGSLKIGVLRKLLEQGYEAHFAIEKYSIWSRQDLEQNMLPLYEFVSLYKRDQNRDYVKQIIAEKSSEIFQIK